MIHTLSLFLAAPWDTDPASSPASDLLLLSDLGRFGPSTGGVVPSADAVHHNLFKNFHLQSLETKERNTLPPTSTARSSNPADDISSLLSKFESSSTARELSLGSGTLSSLNDFEDFDTRALRMVDELDEDDEIAAAKRATTAWGAPPTNSSASYGFSNSYQTGGSIMQSPLKSTIPPPGDQAPPLPTPTNTPAKGAFNLDEFERQLKSGSSSGAAPSSASTDPALANLPQALHHLVLSGQTQPPQAQQTYTGPPLPQFQHGSPAPQGLSIDENDRQHFYIPLPRNQHGLGFMTKSEIALVFRIQLSQLQSIGDPLVDDFYYQVIQARKGGKINASGQVILPVFKSGQARNEDGSPKLPEGTLGRISAFSIHKPRKLMAIGDESTPTSSSIEEDDQPRKANMFAGRTLNYLIEEGYRAAMDLEDVDALLASLAPQRFEDPSRAFDRQRLIAQRAELCTRLLESLDLDEIHLRMNEVASGEHLIFKFYAVPKGRLLIYRSLVLLNPPSTYQLVDVLMHDLNKIAMPTVPAPSTDEKLTFLISDLIYSMPLMPYANEIFGYFLGPKHAPKLVELIRTQMLCQFLQVLFKKGHEAVTILQQNPHVQSIPGIPGVRETVQHWRAIFDGITNGIKGRLAEIFEGLPKDAKPALPTTSTHRNRREKEKTAAASSSSSSTGSSEAPSSTPSPPPAEEKKEPTPSYLSTRFGMWELMAAFFSHANDEQRVWFNPELKEILIKEVENLYGEYRDRKAKQLAANAAAQAEKDKEKEVESSDKKDASESDSTAESKKDESAPTKDRDTRRLHTVPPASTLPPPPSPALRFLSSALLGESSSEYADIAKVWNDLHQDYAYYQHKHQHKVAQEQSRLAHQQQMRAQRQGHHRQQWQQYQQQRNQQHQQQQGSSGPQGSPNRVPPQHAHFHTTPHRAGHHHPRAPHRSPHPNSQPPAQQQPPIVIEPSGPPKPVPVWVKAGTSGAAAVKGTPASSPSK